MTILVKKKQKHKEDINELWKDNDQLCERLRGLEDRSRRDNLRVDGIAEVEMKRGSKQKKSYTIYSKKS